MKRRIIVAAATFGFCYLTLPFVMGAFDVGSRRGPIFYPSDLHRAPFVIGCEMFRGYKPRESVFQSFYRKAYFYGLPERLKSRSEREEVIARIESNHNPGGPYVQRLKEYNEELNQTEN